MGKKKISKQELINKVKELNKKLGRRPQKRDDNRLNYFAKKIFGSWNSLMQEAGYDVRFYQKISKFKPDRNFAYFLGLLITDGHIVYDLSNKKYKVCLYTSYPEEKEMIMGLINNLFGYVPGISSRMYGYNKRPNYEIRIASRNLAEIIVKKIKIKSGAKSSSVRIPKYIINSDVETKGNFLRGVIDGDGSVLKNAIKIASGSPKFLEDLKKMFEEMNIKTCKIVKDNRNTNTFSIRIYGAKNTVKLYPIIYPEKDCFCYKRKKELWKNNIFKYA